MTKVTEKKIEKNAPVTEKFPIGMEVVGKGRASGITRQGTVIGYEGNLVQIQVHGDSLKPFIVGVRKLSKLERALK